MLKVRYSFYRFDLKILLSSYLNILISLQLTYLAVPLLNSHADYTFISKDFAKVMEYTDMVGAAEGFSAMVRKGMTVICPWGDNGAAAKAADGEVIII